MTDAPSTPFEPGTRGWIKALVLDLTGSAVTALTAPGGRGRQSVRAALADGRSVIVTRRETPARAETEAAILQVLSAEGAPVPGVVGFRDGLLVQQDMGRDRLSYVMVHSDEAGRARLARAAIEGLEACRSAMVRRPDVLAKLPGLGTRPGWAETFVSQPFFLSGDLGIARPEVDAEALGAALAHGAETFTRWDARLANAAVQPDGTVAWFNWDLFGRRAGVEDLGWLAGDEYWRLDGAATGALLEAFVPDPARRDLARRVAVLVAANRLKQIAGRLEARGWAEADTVLRLDQVGAVPAIVGDLCDRMAGMAAGDALTEGFVPWFGAVRDTMLARDAGG